MAFLEIEQVSKHFPNPDGRGTFCVFKEARFHIQQGEFVTMVGHSGCGKSTLLNIIAGLEAPSSGGDHPGRQGGGWAGSGPDGGLPDLRLDSMADGLRERQDRGQGRLSVLEPGAGAGIRREISQHHGAQRCGG